MQKVSWRSLLGAALRAAFLVGGVLTSLYFFVCSLTFMSTSFRLIGGKNLSAFFSDSTLLSNPITGVMIGIMVTVLVQSSSTSTSIIVSLVSAGVEVRHAVPMIFGSNVGTSVTNTIVSLTQAADRDTFRRAFAAATVHDAFNWLTLIVLLVVELATGFLQTVTQYIVDHMALGGSNMSSSPDLLKPLTRPFTDLIVDVDEHVLLGWSFHDPAYDNVTTLLVRHCDDAANASVCSVSLFGLMGRDGLGMSDTGLGSILLVLSLVMLVGCLLVLTKILNAVLSTHMAGVIQRTINAQIPGCEWLTGYVAMLVGAVVTILVRSSSVFTSTLTPLCGAGLITLETVYPLTLGSNVGTTTTSMLASLAAEGKYLKPSIQIALVHLFFNLIGLLLFYPIPFMRWPLPMARKLGDLTAHYRWFAVLYLIVMFVLAPLAVFLLSLAGSMAVYGVMGALSAVGGVVAAVTLLQHARPRWLPEALRDWTFLPLWMRSLEPLDRLVMRMDCCCQCTHADHDQCKADADAGEECEKESLV